MPYSDIPKLGVRQHMTNKLYLLYCESYQGFIVVFSSYFACYLFCFATGFGKAHQNSSK